MNRDELAKSLGMSKATLYKRCRALNISIDSLDSLTEDQKTKLRNFKQLNYTQAKKNTTFSDKKDENTEPKHQTEQIEQSDSQLHDYLVQQNKHLQDQLKQKDIQLSNAQDNIRNANKLANEAHKLADQAQQLQLDLQQKLNQSETEKQRLLQDNSSLNAELDQEKHKSFWSRLFGG